MPVYMGSDVVLVSMHYNCPHMHKFPPQHYHIIIFKNHVQDSYKIWGRQTGNSLHRGSSGVTEGVTRLWMVEPQHWDRSLLFPSWCVLTHFWNWETESDRGVDIHAGGAAKPAIRALGCLVERCSRHLVHPLVLNLPGSCFTTMPLIHCLISAHQKVRSVVSTSACKCVEDTLKSGEK